MWLQSNDAEWLKFKGGADFVGPDRDANIGFFVQPVVQPVSMPVRGGGGGYRVVAVGGGGVQQVFDS